MTYEKTDGPLDIGGFLAMKEEPTPEIIPKDAAFYVFTQPTQNGFMLQRYVREGVRSIGPLMQGWGDETPHRVDAPIAGVNDWVSSVWAFKPDDIAPHLSDLTVRGETAHWFPDICAVHLGLVVSEAVRDVLEPLFPGMSYFFPVNVTIIQTGEPIPEPRFYWKPRQAFKFIGRRIRPEKNRTLRRYDFPISSPFARPAIAWELVNNDPLRAYLKNIPFWTLTETNGHFGMSVSVFETLKSHNFSGLWEITGEDRRFHEADLNQNVGYY